MCVGSDIEGFRSLTAQHMYGAEIASVPQDICPQESSTHCRYKPASQSPQHSGLRALIRTDWTGLAIWAPLGQPLSSVGEPARMEMTGQKKLLIIDTDPGVGTYMTAHVCTAVWRKAQRTHTD